MVVIMALIIGDQAGLRPQPGGGGQWDASLDSPFSRARRSSSLTTIMGTSMTDSTMAISMMDSLRITTVPSTERITVATSLAAAPIHPSPTAVLPHTTAVLQTSTVQGRLLSWAPHLEQPSILAMVLPLVHRLA